MSDLIDGRLRWHLGEAERAQHFLRASKRVSYVVYCFVFLQERINTAYACMEFGVPSFYGLGEFEGQIYNLYSVD